MKHELKCWPEYFEAVIKEDKRFEIRKNDRDFKVWDHLLLREWSPDTGKYTGREQRVCVRYILERGFGLEDGYVCMDISKMAYLSIK